MTMDELRIAENELLVRQFLRMSARPGAQMIAIVEGLLAGFLFVIAFAIWMADIMIMLK